MAGPLGTGSCPRPCCSTAGRSQTLPGSTSAWAPLRQRHTGRWIPSRNTEVRAAVVLVVFWAGLERCRRRRSHDGRSAGRRNQGVAASRRNRGRPWDTGSCLGWPGRNRSSSRPWPSGQGATGRRRRRRPPVRAAVVPAPARDRRHYSHGCGAGRRERCLAAWWRNRGRPWETGSRLGRPAYSSRPGSCHRSSSLPWSSCRGATGTRRRQPARAAVVATRAGAGAGRARSSALGCVYTSRRRGRRP